MEKKAVILSLDKKILVSSLAKDECASCTSACNKKINTIEVLNPKKFNLKIGDAVILTNNKKTQALQGLFSLFIPFLSAFIGYFLSDSIFSLFKIQGTEALKALIVLIFLFITSSIIFIITRKFPLPGKPEIKELIGEGKNESSN